MRLALHILWHRIRDWLPFVLGAVVLLVWLGSSSRVPTGDAPHLLTIAHHLADLLRAGDMVDFVDQLGGLITPHPPAGYLVPTVFYALGWTQGAVLGTSLVGLTLTWYGLLLLVRSGGSRRWGPAVGGLLLLSSAMTWSLTEHMAWDLLCAGCVSACLGHLHASDGLRNKGHALAFGLFMGLGFLTKYTFPAFLLLPTLAAGRAVLRFSSWAGLLVAIGAFGVISGPWFLDHGTAVLAYVASSSDPLRTLSASPAIEWAARFSPDNLLFYPTVLRDALGWPGLVLVILAAVPAWTRPEGRWAALGVLSGLLILTFAGESQGRYLFPALPLLCVLIDIGFRPGLGSSGARFGLLVGLSAALPALWGTISTHRADTLVPSSRDQSHPVESLAEWGVWPWPAEAFRPMSTPLVAWKTSAAIAAVAATTGPGTHTIGLAVPADTRMPTASAIAWQAANRGVNWSVASIVTDGPHGRPMVFFGPVAKAGSKARRRFKVAYVIHLHGRFPEALRALNPTVVWEQKLPDGYRGTVVQIPDAAWQTGAGALLLRDPLDG